MSGTARTSVEITASGDDAFAALIARAHDYIEFDTKDIVSLSAKRYGNEWNVQFDLLTDLTR